MKKANIQSGLTIVPQSTFKRRFIRIDSSTLHDTLKSIGYRDPALYKLNGKPREFKEPAVKIDFSELICFSLKKLGKDFGDLSRFKRITSTKCSNCWFEKNITF